MGLKEGTIWKVLADPTVRQNVVSVFVASPERPLWDREAKKAKTDSEGKPIYPQSTNARLVTFKNEGSATFTFDSLAALKKGDMVTIVGPISTTLSYMKSEPYIQGKREYVDVKDAAPQVVREQVKAGTLIEVTELQVQAYEVYVHTPRDRNASAESRSAVNEAEVPSFLRTTEE